MLAAFVGRLRGKEAARVTDYHCRGCYITSGTDTHMLCRAVPLTSMTSDCACGPQTADHLQGGKERYQ